MKIISFFTITFLFFPPLFAGEYFLNSPQKNVYEVTSLSNMDYVFRVDCRTKGKLIISDSISQKHEIFGSCWRTRSCKHKTKDEWILLDENEKPGYYLWKYKGCCQKFVLMRVLDGNTYFSVAVTVRGNEKPAAELVGTDPMQFAIMQEIFWARAAMKEEQEAKECSPEQ